MPNPFPVSSHDSQINRLVHGRINRRRIQLSSFPGAYTIAPKGIDYVLSLNPCPDYPLVYMFALTMI